MTVRRVCQCHLLNVTARLDARITQETKATVARACDSRGEIAGQVEVVKKSRSNWRVFLFVLDNECAQYLAMAPRVTRSDHPHAEYEKPASDSLFRMIKAGTNNFSSTIPFLVYEKDNSV